MHTIRRVSVEVNRSGKGRLSLLEQASKWTNGTLLPEVEEVFDSLPEVNERLQIDRLVIELNSSGADNWEHEVLQELKEKLAAELLQRISTSKSESREPVLRPSEVFYQTLVYFLKHGVLPWSSGINSTVQWDEAIALWLSSFGTAGAPPFRSVSNPELVELLTDPVVRFRFINSLSVSALKTILTRVFAVPESLWIDWTESIGQLSAIESSLPETTIAKPSSAEFQLTTLSRSLFERIAEHRFVYELELELPAVDELLRQLLQDGRIQPGELGSIDFSSKTFTQAQEEIIREYVARGRQHQEIRSVHIPPSVRRSVENVTLNDVGKVRGREFEPAMEGIFIPNAGIILLSPYFSAFFERSGVAKEGQVSDPGLAILLLHFLATGQETAAEFQLALPKILCGLEIEDAIEIPDGIPQLMKDEAAQMLESVIEHWSILKNTTPAGLQESFLQRRGKITKTGNDEWLLQVEQKSFDMLLQQLPWSFQLVKLPWMNRLLRTEWVD